MFWFPAMVAHIEPVLDGRTLHFTKPPLTPSDSDKDVVIVMVPFQGEGPELHEGEFDDDSGVSWNNTGVSFVARGEKGKELLAAHLLERVTKRVLELRRGSVRLPEDLTAKPFDTWEKDYGVAPVQAVLEFVALLTPPGFVDQDDGERSVYASEFMLSHRELEAGE